MGRDALQIEHNIYSFSIMSNYFAIECVHNGKCLEVNKDGPHGVNGVAWDFHGGDHQLWYWDGNFIHNKLYGDDEVLDLDHADFDENTFGRVLLYPKHGGENQQWKIEDGGLVCLYKSARLVLKKKSHPQGQH